MIESTRRIFSSVLLVAVLGLAASNLFALSAFCSFDQSCAASVVMGVAVDGTPQLATSYSSYQSTAVTASEPSSVAFIVTIIGQTSQYLLTLAVLVLIILELAQLHYLKLLFGKRLKRG